MHGTWKTEGGRPGGGAGLIALVVVLAIAGAVLHAIWHTIVEAAEIAAITVVSALGAAALAGAVYAALRIRARVIQSRQDAPGRTIAARVVYQEPPEVRPQLESSYKPAARPPIEAPRAASWPLPGWWEEVRSQVGRDG